MTQLTFNVNEDRGIVLDPQNIKIAPVSHPIGRIRHVLRNAEKVIVKDIMNITPDQNTVLATSCYLKEAIGTDLDIIYEN